MSALTEWIPRLLKPHDADHVVHQSANKNVYHCTVQKCASQWLRTLLSDPIAYRYCGLTPFQYQQHLPGKHDPRKLTDRRFASPFPLATIGSHSH